MKSLLWSVAFFLFFTSCEKEEPVELLSLGSLIQIELTESSTGIVLLCKTEKEYPCANYSLVASEERSRNSYVVNFSGVRPPEGNCATALGPAVAVFNLGELENGVYEVELNTPSFSNKGQLEIKATEIKLHFAQQKGILILSPVLQR